MEKIEKSFSDFLESDEYDRLEEGEREHLESMLFAMMRAGYKAGWLAAGGELPPNSVSSSSETE